MYPLSCNHIAHLRCIEGMYSMQCPLCKEKIINLPAKSRNKIYANAVVYRDQQELENREAARALVDTTPTASRSTHPPALEVVQAMRELYEFGIPDCIIPDVRITVDPESPSLPAGTVYRDTLWLMMQFIEEEFGLRLDGPDDDEDEDPFEDEEETTHKIFTVPINTPEAFRLARQNRTVFNVMSFRISQLPPIQ